jgi:hypothetical protein
MSTSKRNDRSMTKTAQFENEARERRSRRQAARKRHQRLVKAIRYEEPKHARPD